jgi:hypothetical protein
MEPHSNEPGQSPRPCCFCCCSMACTHGQFLSSTFLSLRDRSGLTVFAFIWNVPPAFANPGREYQFAKVKFATRSSALQKGPDEPVPVARPLAAHVKLNVRIVFPSHKFYDLSRALLPCILWLLVTGNPREPLSWLILQLACRTHS